MRLSGAVLFSCMVLMPSIHGSAPALAARSDAAPEFEPGASLQRLLADTPIHDLRFGLNGAPPGAIGRVPQAPDPPGSHWLVSFDAQARPKAWHRFAVVGMSEPTARAERRLDVLLDARAPDVELRISDPQVFKDGVRVLGPGARLDIVASDPSGGVHAVLQADGLPVEPQTWAREVSEGLVRLAVDAEDALGNRALSEVTHVWLDRSPPTLRWERLNRREGVPEDVFDGRRARVRVFAHDPQAGVSMIRVAGRELDPVRADREGIELSVDAGALGYVIEDAVGNRSEGRLPLRVDSDGPRLEVHVDGMKIIDPDALQVQQHQVLSLHAVDAPAGVARACIEASVWYRECRPLPMDLVGLAPGRYALEFRAADTLGNRSARRFSVEVQR